MTDGWEKVKASPAALRLTNPIRDIVDQLKLPSDNPKALISLSIGDPTVYGNLHAPENVSNALVERIKEHKFNGYAHSAGYAETRAAVARKFSSKEHPLTAEDVVIASGCSGALDLAVSVLATEGQNLLLPAPGFSLYQTLCEHKGVETRHYKLLPDKCWEADLQQLETLIDKKTAAIIVNNPSNPCGSVYSKEHLQDILKVAEKHHIPIIADEIYGDMVFGSRKFYPIASLTDTVPVLSVGGIAKIYLAPGWRLGWVLIHDRHNLFEEVRVGLIKLSQLILGANTLMQSVVEEALFNTPPEYYENLRRVLEENVNYIMLRLSKIPGLRVVEPGGAMYMMLGFEPQKFKDLPNDIEFSKKLLEEEVVFVLPGTIFKCENFMRLVVCPPLEKLVEACDRIEAFCQRHHLGT